MINYIHTGTAEYPLTENEIKSRHPETSFPRPFEPLPEYAQVLAGEQPTSDHTQRVVEIAPALVDGNYVQQWQLEPLSNDELQALAAARAAQERNERNRRLAACDWTQIPDAAGAAVDVPAWTEYRKKLRAIPEQPGFPWDVQWPSEPSAPTGPVLDYGTFFNMLVGSSVYAAIRAKAATDSAVLIPCIELMNALGDARNGRPNPALIQAGLSALVTAARFNEGELAAFQALLDGLGFSAVYSLS